MLREVYIIANGLNLFHYSSDLNDDNVVKSNLTSGFLSALQSFSLQARESAIEFFSSKDEYFLFTPLGISEMMLVCVFDKATQREIADSLLKQIRVILLNSYIAQPDFSNTIYVDKNRIIFDEIRELTQNPFDSQYLVSIAGKIFDKENSISSMRVINLQSNEIYYENARPKPLLKEIQISELNLLLAAIGKLCERFEYPNFEFVTINCQSSIFALFRKIDTLVVMFSSGMVNLDQIKQNVLQIFENKTSKEFFAGYNENQIAESAVNLNSSGEIISQRGQIPFPMIEIFLSTAINALDRFVSSYIRKNFKDVTIYFPNESKSSIEIMKLHDVHQVSFR